MNEPVVVEDGEVAKTEDDVGIQDPIGPPVLDCCKAVGVLVDVGIVEKLMS